MDFKEQNDIPIRNLEDSEFARQKAIALKKEESNKNKNITRERRPVVTREQREVNKEAIRLLNVSGIRFALVLAFKTLIRTSSEEVLNLENALARLQHCQRRIAVLHYAPIKETLQGEPQEMCLGSRIMAHPAARRRAASPCILCAALYRCAAPCLIAS